jgi:hypothetical protein
LRSCRRGRRLRTLWRSVHMCPSGKPGLRERRKARTRATIQHEAHKPGSTGGGNTALSCQH